MNNLLWAFWLAALCYPCWWRKWSPGTEDRFPQLEVCAYDVGFPPLVVSFVRLTYWLNQGILLTWREELLVCYWPDVRGYRLFSQWKLFVLTSHNAICASVLYFIRLVTKQNTFHVMQEKVFYLKQNTHMQASGTDYQRRGLRVADFSSQGFGFCEVFRMYNFIPLFQKPATS